MEDPLIKERLKKDRDHRLYMKGLMTIIVSILLFITFAYYAG